MSGIMNIEEQHCDCVFTKEEIERLVDLTKEPSHIDPLFAVLTEAGTTPDDAFLAFQSSMYPGTGDPYPQTESKLRLTAMFDSSLLYILAMTKAC